MPIYEFTCCDCKKKYSELSKYDPSGEYPEVACPKCNSKKKEREFSVPVICGTSSRMDRFDYRAGHNLARAQDHRRWAELQSHMGADPYGAGDLGYANANNDDLQLNEGLHDFDPRTQEISESTGEIDSLE